MATIYDVAKAAGVSPKTVSRVLNDDAPVGRTTREAVQDAISRLGYVPSNAARVMRSNRSGLIGLITGAISNTPEAGDPKGLPELYIVQGVQEIFAEEAKTLMISDTGGRSDRVPALVSTFRQHRVEGLIYVADYHRQTRFEVRPGGPPVVLANCYDTIGTPSVLPDDRSCQRSLVARLIEAGHRRIGYLTLGNYMDATGLRIEGYRDAHADAGLSVDPDLILEAYREDHTPMTSALNRLLELPEPPSVICCGNDEMAMRLYGLLRTRGVEVPEEISVAGFDNYRAIAETLFPPLTTVELPYRELGRRAARRLLGIIAKDPPGTDDPVRIPGPVVWRSSVTAR
ncbi:LacI family DNA-binding transcriptional regulator [Histidinibacterium aquaticum]|uniref:LacI family DNA-binding transcriptional regulator n=1 Tax=Histidinibacterium aquaticum TaxID=2613962 RepID=A0A5J5GJA9_9RHOB|nr:LacI family DNA-binding transcriptional regulator [Histidinibacterium aquaticum]KAA9008140.1 LacI family DNA-binding transcriptional regulator [Histidinibacterium aquaticum]